MTNTQPARWNELLTSAHVWYLETESVSVSLVERLCSRWITAAELAKITTLCTERLRHMHRTAKFLRNRMLSHFAGVAPEAWRFVTGTNGKPSLGDPPEYISLEFNLTHTDGLVVCILSRAGRVGVDAEDTSREVDIAEVTPHFFSSAERARISAAPTDQRASRFFEQWTVKEAYFKGLGTGLPSAPEKLTIDWSDDDQPLPLENWQFSLNRPTPHHVAAAAVYRASGASSIPVHWLDARALIETSVAVER